MRACLSSCVETWVASRLVINNTSSVRMIASNPSQHWKGARNISLLGRVCVGRNVTGFETRDLSHSARVEHSLYMGVHAPPPYSSRRCAASLPDRSPFPPA